LSDVSKIEQFWYSKSIWRWLFLPLSLLVQMIALSKRFLYRINLIKSRQNRVPVLVVGNITVGGTGKTPFINYLVKKLQSKNIKVGIVSRGYKSNAPEYPYLIKQTDSVEVTGDEAFMQNATLQVPMVIGFDRAAAVDLLCQTNNLDLIISDDGLQHYKMARAFEILMIDGSRLFGNQLMLPVGPLREPVSRMKSVDYVVQNGNVENGETIKNLSNGNVPLASMSLKVTGLININSNQSVELDASKATSITAVAGIGNPQRFFTSLSKFCDRPVEDIDTKVFPDHHGFQLDDFQSINSDIVVMTEKDAVKCESFAQDNWYYLKVEAELSEKDFVSLFELIKTELKN